MMNLILICLLCGLYGVLAKDKAQKGKYSVPILDVKTRQLVLDTNQTLLLSCRGRWELAWAFPSGLLRGEVQVEEFRCGRTGKLFCSRLTVSSTETQHTGLLRCRYRHRTRRQTSIYLYVTDSQQPFVDHPDMSPDVLYMKDKQPLDIPCRVTHPNITTTLVKYPNLSLSPDHRVILWNSKKGFTIRTPTFYYIGLFYCQTVTEGVTHMSRKYFIYRPVSNIMEVYLNSSGPVEALKGERLVLNCTATGELNTRVNITWDYPGKINNTGSTSKRLLKHRTHMLFYNILTIPKLQRSDRGLYTCRVTSGEKTKEQRVNVTVFDRPFIRLKPRHGSVIKVQAGQKSYRISPKLRAFPEPQVIWLKDGMVAAEQCSRYHMDGTALVIRDVAEEDAGKYTVLVRILEHGLYQNLTLTLVVNVSPQIGEKAVSLQDPGSVPRGSRTALHCTSHGVPPPHIQWLWHPCPSKGLCVCPTSSSLWSPVIERVPATSTSNHILSVTHRQEVLQGKNKTVGVLTVAEASVSGGYRCVAFNAAGADQLHIHFYVTDVPGGFSASQREEPREGRDLHLTCSANKYLYGALSWQRVNDTGHGQSRGPASQQLQLTSGEFSNSLVLLLSNLTATDTGAYRCSTHHLVTGQNTHLDTQVEVTILEPPVLLDNLTDCTVNVSSSVFLSCPSAGVPPPTVTWYKDEQALSQGSGIVISPDDGTLNIDRITAEDQGLYTCHATNERGSAESSAYIWVNGASEASFLEIPALTCTCVVATLLWLFLTLVIRKLKQPNSSNTKPEFLSIILDRGDGPMEEPCERLQYDPSQWEFPRERLKLGKPLGRGAFGKVVQAAAFGIENTTSCTTVAVKMLKEGATASEHKALMTELKILNHIGHHLNVVNLLGACTKPEGPLMVIVEYCCYGNLSTFLKGKREVFVHDRDGEPGFVSSVFDDNRENHLDTKSGSNSPLFLEDLISFSFQVVRGMEFLASRKCIHRDLAARNILLSDNKVVKICDFGLARDIYKDPDYVRKGDARLPLKWMSPEAIFDKVFTTQSDVWSFGILLWEIFSLGASPYPGLQIDEEFCHRLKGGTRMRAPEYSTPEIYSTMLACWEAGPSDRPTFTNLVETLGDLLQARVQQEGKDYIPLGSFTAGETGRSVTCKENPLAVTNLSYMRGMATLQTFEELPCVEPDSLNDELSDSGMVLPSEELKHVTWNKCTKSEKLSRLFSFTKCRDHPMPFFCDDISGLRSNEPSILPSDWASDEGSSPPPDYNSAFLYPSL
ncbi:LOW QUALITY PROTEIN: vascular endothelial growth factor receptor 1 [Trematomus bernacchii]|uniref:LOW QUALITY PROTEIN: vascular endothelial growth factor receptor 1 n=1 Tax=Trematomus bernacchii TaxID=40690 RepID=UPI00146B13F4|nr:LOW QUALITY PROTEIN: vascular endothelial growth factor receptor 1 [Trematomus bernacchii]